MLFFFWFEYSVILMHGNKFLKDDSSYQTCLINIISWALEVLIPTENFTELTSIEKIETKLPYKDNSSKVCLISLVPNFIHYSSWQGSAARGNLSKEDAAFICVEAVEAVPQRGFMFEVGKHLHIQLHSVKLICWRFSFDIWTSWTNPVYHVAWGEPTVCPRFLPNTR